MFANRLVHTVVVAAATTLLGGLAVASPAAATPRPGNVHPSCIGGGDCRSTKVVVKNHVSNLHRTDWKLLHGVWGILPPEDIPHNSVRTWQSVSQGAGTGTEGWMTFSSPSGEVKFYWDNPYLLDNKYSCDVPPDLECSRDGGDGNNTTVTFTLNDRLS